MREILGRANFWCHSVPLAALAIGTAALCQKESIGNLIEDIRTPDPSHVVCVEGMVPSKNGDAISAAQDAARKSHIKDAWGMHSAGSDAHHSVDGKVERWQQFTFSVATNGEVRFTPECDQLPPLPDGTRLLQPE